MAPPPVPYGLAPVPYGAPADSSKKVAAGVCGILLGGLGIHKFVLGYTTEGMVMLLVSIIGGLFTCGIASVVMGIIGLIEGIIYLTKSDQEFVASYQVQKRGWF